MARRVEIAAARNSAGDIDLSSKHYYLCTRGDEGTRLVFSRPDEFFFDDLILHFAAGGQSFSPVNIRQDNDFFIPGALTRAAELRVQAEFRNDGGGERSNTLMFALREAL